jgi:hypothetical protein
MTTNLRRVAAMAAALDLIVVAGYGAVRSQDAAANPFAFLAPWVQVSPGERERLDRGEVVARTLPATGSQVAVFVAARVQAAPETLVAWTRAIDAFKRSPAVLAIGTFSEPPLLSDLDALVLDDVDVEDAARCRPGHCGLKLTAREIAALGAATSVTDGGRRDAVQRAFRQVVLERVRTYRAQGIAGLPALADRASTRRIADGLSAILDRSPYLARLPSVIDWIRQFPRVEGPDDTLLYWSKESLGSGKPVITVTHVGIVRPPPARDRPAVLVTGTQLLATHYTNASLGLTMLVPGLGGAEHYLVYLNRTDVDVLGGMFSGMVRATIERRLNRQAPLVVRVLRSRLESGSPPASRRSHVP